MENKKDIFISYKNDGEGNNFAARLCAHLKGMGYDVYYNSDEQHAGNFPEILRDAVRNCKDFLLILTQACLDQLKRHDKVDWIREEVLTAYNNKKNIIPLLMPGVTMPKDKNEMPEDLRFLPDKNAIVMPESYDKSPLDTLLSWMNSKPEKKYVFRDCYNSSTENSIDKDMQNAIGNAGCDDYAAMYELANYYYYGLATDAGEGCGRDYAKAYNLLKRISDADCEYSPYADAIIGEMYHLGIVPRQSQSYENAFVYHERSKDKSGFSAREYAYLKSRGYGCDFCYEEIENSYLSAVEQRDNIAIVTLAKLYTSYGQFRKAAELYKKTRGLIPDAEYRLGMLYRDGVLEDPPRPDFFRAAFYFQHAIDSGKCEADVYFQLGRLYFTPVGDFPKDFRVAEKNFIIAADMGHKGAQYKLGLMYEYGLVEKDLKKAVHYHTLAAEKGINFSAYHLAMLLCEEGFRNYHRAFEYAEYAARKGVMEAEYLLGVFLYYGRGCVANEDRAYKYFTKALNHGMYQAKIMIDRIKSPDGK